MTKQDSKILICQSQSGSIKINVRIENDTVWPAQKTIAELFKTTKQNIKLH